MLRKKANLSSICQKDDISMAPSPMLVPIISTYKDRSSHLQSACVKSPSKASCKISMREQIEVIVMADRSIEELLSHWYT